MGSDAHRKNSIYLQIPKAISLISKYIDQDELQNIITHNAEKVLSGEYL